MTTSVLLPTYNERAVILDLVREILDAVADAEVLVVDDDSPDGTWEAVATAYADDPRARVLRRVGRRGGGARPPAAHHHNGQPQP